MDFSTLDLRGQSGVEQLYGEFSEADVRVRTTGVGTSPHEIEVAGCLIQLYHPLDGVFSRKFANNTGAWVTVQTARFGNDFAIKFFDDSGNRRAMLVYDPIKGALVMYGESGGKTLRYVGREVENIDYEALLFMEGALSATRGGRVSLVDDDVRDEMHVRWFRETVKRQRDVYGSEQNAFVQIGRKNRGVAVSALTPMLRSTYESDREAAVRLLGAIGGQEVVQPLIESMDDPFTDIRRAAVGALASAGHAKDIVDHLIRFLVNEHDVGVASDIERAIVSAGSDAVNPLKTVLINRTERPVAQRAALELLMKIATPEVIIEPLQTILESEPYSAFSIIAAKTLGSVGKTHEDALTYLRRMAFSPEADDEKRFIAFVGLGQAEEYVDREEGTKDFVNALGSRNEEIRYVALCAISYAGIYNEWIESCVERMAENDPSKTIRRYARAVIRRWGPDSV